MSTAIDIASIGGDEPAAVARQHNATGGGSGLDFVPYAQHSAEEVSGSMEGGPLPDGAPHITHRSAGRFIEGKGFGWLLDVEDELEDEEGGQLPLLDELDIDPTDIYYKVRCVLLPLPYFRLKLSLVRDSPDFWGPLAVVVAFSLLSLYGQMSVVSWIVTMWLLGSFVVFFLARALGGDVGYTQCLGIVGYCLIPMVVTGVAAGLLPRWEAARHALKLFGVAWSVYSAGALLCVDELHGKEPLILYPVFLLYVYFLSLYTEPRARAAMEAPADGGDGRPTLLTLLSPGTAVPHALARILGYACTPQQLHDNVAPVCRQLYDFVHGGEYGDLMYNQLVVRYDGKENDRDMMFMQQLCATLRRIKMCVGDTGYVPPPASLFAGHQWHRLVELELAGGVGPLNDVPGDTLAALVQATPALRVFKADCVDLGGQWKPAHTAYGINVPGKYVRSPFTLTDGWPHLRTVELCRCHPEFVHCVVLQTRNVHRAKISLWSGDRVNRQYTGNMDLESQRPTFAELVERNCGTLASLNMDWRLVRRSSANEPGDMDALGRCLELTEFRLAAGMIYDHAKAFDVAQCMQLLAGLPRLDTVQLYSQAVGHGAVAALADCRLPAVTALHLHPWSMESRFAHAVIMMAPSLRHVHLANVERLDDALLTAIVYALPMLTWLKMSFATLDHDAKWLCLDNVPNDELKHIELINLHIASTKCPPGAAATGLLRAALLAVARRGVASVRFQGERLDAVA